MFNKLNSNSTSLDLPNGKKTIILIRRSKKSHRLKIRMLPGIGQVELVLPDYLQLKDGLLFLKQKICWISKQLETHPDPIPFCDGSIIRLFDQPLQIYHVTETGSDVWCDGQKLMVAAPKKELSRAISDWYKREAGCTLKTIVDEKTALLGLGYSRLTIRDTKSRWGSCSGSGHLSFSWRIIMAPRFVSDYIVSHEVAHLKEMNHSETFWNIVRSLSNNVDEGRSWLRLNGYRLHSYGVELPEREFCASK